MLHPPELRSAAGLRWFGVTDRGKVRKNNEDAFLGVQFDAREFHYLGKHGEASLGHHDYAFAVSDGIGGNRAGEFASRVAVEKITRLLPKSYQQSAKGMEAGFADVLSEVYDQIHKAINFFGLDEETRGMGATLSLGWFTPGWMYWAHIGDSRIYYLPAEGGLRQLSHDDTHVGWLYRNAKISEHQARTHPARNQLQRALGAGHQFVDPQVGSVSCGKGDLFLICSDGVTDGLYDEQILEILRSPAGMQIEPNPALRLVKESLERSGRDNTTAVVVEIL
ncbi:MAG TPA: protein phosphatase 2C domain-containing protein [Chthoniobacteraceae bacterium]|jgi:protein phosphatase|nr:protein phosphatase 2C domain-containing protein [Chthoniobacteraceae bacterium]